MKLLEMDETLLNRPVNEGFSGGEKKRNEIFQMAVLEPKLAILDETDSGLDIDALRIVADGVNKLRTPRALFGPFDRRFRSRARKSRSDRADRVSKTSLR